MPADRDQGARGASSATDALGGVARPRPDRPAIASPAALEDLDEQVDALVGRAPRTGRPRSARPSLMRHSGVLMSRIDASSRPCAIDQVGLLPGVLEVVARVRLVGDDVEQVRARGPAGRC